MSDSIYDNPLFIISFQEYGSPLGPLTQGRILGQGIEHEIVDVTEIVPPYTVVVPTGNEVYPGYTVTKQIAKSFTVFYCYGSDGVTKKVLPENITFLNS